MKFYHCEMNGKNTGERLRRYLRSKYAPGEYVDTNDVFVIYIENYSASHSEKMLSTVHAKFEQNLARITIGSGGSFGLLHPGTHEKRNEEIYLDMVEWSKNWDMAIGPLKDGKYPFQNNNDETN